MDSKTIEIDGVSFVLYPIPVLKVMKLDKQLITMLLPSIPDMSDIDQEIDFGSILKNFSESLSNLSEKDYLSFVMDLLSKTQAQAPGSPAVEFTSEETLNLFQGRLSTLYKLLFEIMKYNKFTPFELASGGLGMSLTNFFQDQSQSIKSDGEK